MRSTFIVGFPGETKEDFNCLLEFLEKQKMQYVGFFKYSREEYTAAYQMPNQIKERVKDERLAKVQEIQEKIMLESQKRFIGHTTLCVLEKVYDNHTLALRNQYNSPGVDSLVFAKKGDKDVKVGEFYKVKITGQDGVDLVGEIV